MGECQTNGQNGSCEDKGSCEPKKSNDGCTMAEDILCLAKQAKHELLKEKMKKALEAKVGKKLDTVAGVAVDALIACMEAKMEAKEACHNYKEKLFAALKG